MGAPLKYLLITFKVVALEKVYFSNRQIPKTVRNTLLADDKHYQHNRDNLAQPIQMQLYQKQKTFSESFSCIPKIYIKF